MTDVDWEMRYWQWYRELEAKHARLREAAEALWDSIEYGLDLSDRVELEDASSAELVRATRPASVWLELKGRQTDLGAALKETL